MSFVKSLIRNLCMKPFDTEKLRQQLEIDEGVVHEIYKDHLGYPTFGIGHLITESDPEYGFAIGTRVGEARVEEAYQEDIAEVLTDCVIAFPSWDSYPEEAQQVFANMMFNLGRTRLSKFVNMIAAAEDSNWVTAAAEGRDSKWYRQVTVRAERLMTRLENI